MLAHVRATLAKYRDNLFPHGKDSMLPLFAELSPSTFAILARRGPDDLHAAGAHASEQLKAAAGSHSHAKASQHAPAGRRLATETQPARQMEQWEVRMHELARELSAQLDSKMVAAGIARARGPGADRPLGAADANEPAAGRIAAIGRGGQAAPRRPPAQSSARNLAALRRPRCRVPRPASAARPAAEQFQAPSRGLRAGRRRDSRARPSPSSLTRPIGEVELILGLRRPEISGGAS